MHQLKPKDWRSVLEINNLSRQAQSPISSDFWSLKNLWQSLMKGQIFSNSKDFIWSIVVLRNTKVSLELDFVKTHQAHQRKGLMSSNFKYLKDISHNQNLPIWLEVSEKNKMAHSFYQKQGFKFQYLRKNYYKNGENARIYNYFCE